MKRNFSWKYYTAIAGTSLFLAIIACNAPAGGDITPTAPTEQATPLSIPTSMGEAPAVATTVAPAAPTTTPTLTATPTTPCDYDSVYVADVSIPDGTEIVTGAGFTKTWRVQNNGCQPWPGGTVLLFVEGSQMGGPISVPVPATAAGGTQDISVPLTAPGTPGDYKGYWRLRSADGIQFGDKIYVNIKAVSPTPVPPTATLMLILPPLELARPDLYVSEFSLNPTTPVQGSPVHVRVGVYNKGTAAANTSFVVRWYGGENFANVSCEWTVDSLVKNGGRILECDFTYGSWYASINTKVVVDATGTVAESDETNNIFLKAISVAQP